MSIPLDILGLYLRMDRKEMIKNEIREKTGNDKHKLQPVIVESFSKKIVTGPRVGTSEL